MTSSFDNSPMRDRVESFYRREARLLQDGRYEDWLAGFAEEFHYRMPIVRSTDARAEMVAADGELGYYDEDRHTMELRVRKFASSMAWTETPPSRLRYFVQVIEVEEDGDSVRAVSNFLVFRTRHESHENIFYGERFDRFVSEQGELKLKDRRAVVDKSRLAAENLSIFL